MPYMFHHLASRQRRLPRVMAMESDDMFESTFKHPAGIERRQVERIVFQELLGGSVRSGPVRIADLSVRGARCVHLFPFTPGDLIRITFAWQEERFSLSSHVMRCSIKSESDDGPLVFESGLRFTSQLEVKASGLTNLMAEYVISTYRRSHSSGTTATSAQNDS